MKGKEGGKKEKRLRTEEGMDGGRFNKKRKSKTADSIFYRNHTYRCNILSLIVSLFSDTLLSPTPYAF